MSAHNIISYGDDVINLVREAGVSSCYMGPTNEVQQFI